MGLRCRFEHAFERMQLPSKQKVRRTCIRKSKARHVLLSTAPIARITDTHLLADRHMRGRSNREPSESLDFRDTNAKQAKKNDGNGPWPDGRGARRVLQYLDSL